MTTLACWFSRCASHAWGYRTTPSPASLSTAPSSSGATWPRKTWLVRISAERPCGKRSRCEASQHCSGATWPARPGSCRSVQRGWAKSDPVVKRHSTACPRPPDCPVPAPPGKAGPGSCGSVRRGHAESDPVVKCFSTACPRPPASSPTHSCKEDRH